MTQPTLTPQDIKAQYGFITALANAVPDINKILQQAVKGQWSVSRFQMAIANTSWWKKTGDIARNWLITQISDPATAAHEMQDGAAQVIQLAQQQGFTAAQVQADAQNIWLQSKLNGMSDQQLAGYIASREWTKLSGNTQVNGSIGNIEDQAKQMAAAYGYNPADLDAEVLQMAAADAEAQRTGSDALAGWQQKMINYASVKYAPFADQIKQGQTVSDIAKPYTDAYQQILEQPASQDINDPLIAKALQGTPDKNGQPVATPLWQFQQQLRADPRWAQTDNARQSMAQAVTQIGKTFGFIGS